MFDIIIKDGLVINGTGSHATREDIGIQGDTIIEVGKIEGGQAAEIVVAEGLLVCPGFIDIHSHSDFNILIDPPGQSKIQQGVTTEVCGNCGLSAAPLLGKAKEQRKKSLSALGVDITWSSLRDFLKVIEGKKLFSNIVPLVGHGNIRGAVIGYTNRAPSSTEMNMMVQLLKEELASGAWGLSSGLVYPPGVYANEEELVCLTKVVAQSGGLYATHMRSEEDDVVQAVEEALRVAQESVVALQISHIKTMGQKNWAKLSLIFQKIEEASAKGLNITADRYPYTAASTDLDSLLPPWASEGGIDAVLRRLSSHNLREKIFSYILNGRSKQYLSDEILICRVFSPHNKSLEGKTLAQAAAMRNQSIKETFFNLLIEEKLRVGAIFFCMSEENLKKILQKDYVMIGSDSAVWDVTGPLSEGKPHPRGFGTFPRILSKYVFEEEILTIQAAVKKFTGQPASKLGLRDRGLIQKGYKADLVILKKEALKDYATYKNPHQFPSGIYDVMVNGQWALRKGQQTGAYPGRVLLKNC